LVSGHIKGLKLNARSIVIMALLIALQVILTRFLSFNQWNMRIGFGFVPVVMAAVMLGPISAALTGGIADFIGAILFPTGTYFPGFTLTAALMGLVFGLFLYKKQTFIFVIVSVAVNQLILSLLLNTFWISVLYGSPFFGLIPTRVIQSAINIPVQITVSWLIIKSVGVFLKRHASQYS